MPNSQMSKVLEYLRNFSGAEKKSVSDAQLLERFLISRDEAAFETLVQRHGSMVLGVCRRILKNVHDAEDAFQATFLVLVRKAMTLINRETVGGFLYGVAYKTALKAREAKVRRQRRERKAGAMPRRETLEENIDHELLAVLDHELSRLPDKYRVPIVLCDLEGKTRKEAANQLGWPEGSLSGRLARARALLAKRLRRHGLPLASGMMALELSGKGATACVSQSLAASTIKAAVCLTTGQAALAGAISPKVVALMDGVLKSMLLTKLKVATAVALMAGVLSGGLLVRLVFSEPSQPAGQRAGSVSDGSAAVANASGSLTCSPQSGMDQSGDPLPPGAIARLGTVRWRLPQFGVDRLVVASEGKTLMMVNPLGGISIWDNATGRIVRHIPSEHEPRPEWLSRNRQWTNGQSGASQRATALSADAGTAVFAAPDGVLYVLDIATAKVRQRFRGHRGIIQETALSAAGQVLASRSEDGTLRIWELSSGEEIRRLELGEQRWGQHQPTHLALSSDGKTAAWVGTESERPIHVYDVSRGEETHCLLEHPGGERGIAFSPRGHLLLASCSKGPDQLWDVRTGRLLRTLPHKPVHYPSAVAFTVDGSRLALAVPGAGLQLYEAGTGKEVWRIDSTWMSTEPEILAFSPDGKTLFAKRAEWPSWVLRRYDARTGKLLAAPGEARGNIVAMVFAPDDRSLHTRCWDSRLWTWNASTGAVVQQTEISLPVSYEFSPDGRFLVLSDLSRLSLYQLDLRKEVWRQTTVGGRPSYAIAFSADGASLAVSEWPNQKKGLGPCIVFRSTASGAEQGRIDGLDQQALDFRFNPDGRSLLWLAPHSRPELGSSWAIHFRELSSGRKLREPLPWAPMTLNPVAFSPDGKTLALASPNRKSIDLWEYAVWKKRLELPPVTHYPCPLAFTPDGLLCMMADDDGAVRIFDAHSGRLLRRQEGHRAAVDQFIFSHDGRKLVTASLDTTALVWDISDLLRTARGREQEIREDELRLLWEDLASEDAAKAYQAIGRLARSGNKVLPWMRKHLQPAPGVDPQRLAKLAADLDDDRFAVRETATTRLAELGELAAPALRKVLAGHPSPELRRRAESLLNRAEEGSAGKRRIARSVEVVETIGGSEAEKSLREWAAGAAGARLTREAKASLERLTKRQHPEP